MDGNIKSSLAAGVGLIYLVGTAVVVFVIILIINAVRTNKPTA